MPYIMSIAVGLGLSAACGFRIFVPMLAAGIASRMGVINLSESFQWIGSIPAISIFAVATIAEIGAYYIPWVDNALDTIAGSTAIAAGVFLSAAALGDMPPELKWTLAIVAGGGAAGIIQGLTSGIRLGSTATTGGFGNPVVSTAEVAASTAFSLLAILLPLAICIAFALLAVLLVYWFFFRGSAVATEVA